MKRVTVMVMSSIFQRFIFYFYVERFKISVYKCILQNTKHAKVMYVYL